MRKPKFEKLKEPPAKPSQPDLVSYFTRNFGQRLHIAKLNLDYGDDSMFKPAYKENC